MEKEEKKKKRNREQSIRNSTEQSGREDRRTRKENKKRREKNCYSYAKEGKEQLPNNYLQVHLQSVRRRTKYLSL
jgi:hypothetical protein